MPLLQLERECADRLLIAQCHDLPSGGEERRTALIDRLLLGMCAPAFEQKGLSVMRLGSLMCAKQLIEKWDQLDQMDFAKLVAT